jgi:hypothetical protein
MLLQPFFGEGPGPGQVCRGVRGPATYWAPAESIRPKAVFQFPEVVTSSPHRGLEYLEARFGFGLFRSHLLDILKGCIQLPLYQIEMRFVRDSLVPWLLRHAVWSYDRAIAPFFWANYLPEKLGGEQLYLMGLRDTKGTLLSGKNSYRLRVPAEVPVDKFWSAIVYSQKTKSFIANPLNRIGLDSYDKSKLKTNPDGSVDIYFGNKARKGYESNWLPSAGEDFFAIFRLYGPAKSVYERTWKLPDIELVPCWKPLGQPKQRAPAPR